jgi:hypothetical protein
MNGASQSDFGQLRRWRATIMKPLSLIGTGVLLLVLGALAPTPAQQEPHRQETSKQEKRGKPENQPQPHSQQKAKEPEHRQAQRTESRAQRPPQIKTQQNRQPQHPARSHQVHRTSVEHRAAWQAHRAHNWQAEHRTWRQRGGYHGYRIPQDRYRMYFGRSHWFPIYRYPVVVVGGYPRFQYQGLWFSIVDPWPQSWADDWYDTDDVYIDYSGDGYYMYDRRYPGVALAISVSVN